MKNLKLLLVLILSSCALHGMNDQARFADGTWRALFKTKNPCDPAAYEAVLKRLTTSGMSPEDIQKEVSASFADVAYLCMKSGNLHRLTQINLQNGGKVHAGPLSHLLDSTMEPDTFYSSWNDRRATMLAYLASQRMRDWGKPFEPSQEVANDIGASVKLIIDSAASELSPLNLGDHLALAIESGNKCVAESLLAAGAAEDDSSLTKAIDHARWFSENSYDPRYYQGYTLGNLLRRFLKKQLHKPQIDPRLLDPEDRELERSAQEVLSLLERHRREQTKTSQG